jgi:hypothetical protein
MKSGWCNSRSRKAGISQIHIRLIIPRGTFADYLHCQDVGFG